MGKTAADYTPNKRSVVVVTIINASKLSMREKKRSTKMYQTYSGYASGRKLESFADLSNRRGVAEPIRRAVRRMLPRNTFLTARMKNLVINK